MGLIAALFISTAAVAGYSHPSRAASARLRTNPPVAHTGGFGEPTCIKCHSLYEPNDTSGSLVIDGFPAQYRAGERYRISLTVRHPGLIVGGFQIAARFEGGGSAGKQAGDFASIDTLTMSTIDSTSKVKYMHHSTAGVTAAAQRGIAKWTFQWIAPANDSGSVMIHVVGNAGNDDFSELGDWIYTRVIPLRGPG